MDGVNFPAPQSVAPRKRRVSRNNDYRNDLIDENVAPRKRRVSGNERLKNGQLLYLAKKRADEAHSFLQLERL